LPRKVRENKIGCQAPSRLWRKNANIYSRGKNGQNIFHDEIDMMEALRLLSIKHEDFTISIWLIPS
jgi:hypothetical protein